MTALEFLAVSLELRHKLGAGVPIIATPRLPACSKPSASRRAMTLGCLRYEKNAARPLEPTATPTAPGWSLLVEAIAVDAKMRARRQVKA